MNFSGLFDGLIVFMIIIVLFFMSAAGFIGWSLGNKSGNHAVLQENGCIKYHESTGEEYINYPCTITGETK